MYIAFMLGLVKRLISAFTAKHDFDLYFELNLDSLCRIAYLDLNGGFELTHI